MSHEFPDTNTASAQVRNVLRTATTHYAECIRSHRERLGRSLRIVAHEAGTSKAHLWNMETGRSGNPSISTLLGLACALEINPHELFAAAVLDQPGVRVEIRNNIENIPDVEITVTGDRS